MVPSQVRNTETELVSHKYKEHKVNKRTALLPFKTHWYLDTDKDPYHRRIFFFSQNFPHLS